MPDATNDNGRIYQQIRRQSKGQLKGCASPRKDASQGPTHQCGDETRYLFRPAAQNPLSLSRFGHQDLERNACRDVCLVDKNVLGTSKSKNVKKWSSSGLRTCNTLVMNPLILQPLEIEGSSNHRSWKRSSPPGLSAASKVSRNRNASFAYTSTFIHMTVSYV